MPPWTFDSDLRTVDVRAGYGEWVATYDDRAAQQLDLGLMDALRTVRWEDAGRVADLACGTGRTGAWLRGKGAAEAVLHGVDLTPEMLARARARGEHDRLVEADATATGLDDGAYDLVLAALIDQHLQSLRPLYREARRLLGETGAFVIAGQHPLWFMLSGRPTHFESADGETVAIETHVHLFSDHLVAAQAAGFALAELREATVDDEWAQRTPELARWRAHPVSYAAVWTPAAPTA